MKQSLIRKNLIIEQITKRIDKSKSLVVASYSNISVSDIESLRNELRTQDSELKVYKNNLFNLAIEKTEHKELTKYLVGPNAFIFGYNDMISALKIAAKFSKKYNNFELKAGIYNNNVLNSKSVMEVALLPSKEELIASFASLLTQPLIKFALSIKEIINKKSESTI